MKIRVADDKDVEMLISTINDVVIVNSSYLGDNWFKKRILGNKSVYVLEDEGVGFIGLLVAYNKKYLGKVKLLDNKVINYILKKYPGDFYYLDFLAIKKSELNKGMEKILISSILDDAKKKMVYTGVNLNSDLSDEQYLKELDFFDFSTVEKIPNEENPEFEIYEKEA
ncbi:hypothetical protein HN385_01640 [archaeon]|nr:hypothetical protein [archaeon]MBT3451533.1 hypothetical protein [archaeon]MBT6869392.1 hypothetical protein [archaeon]MBT7192555.1 hypothetical protein [archaeon]MBT7380631.1 hypothetical protein [archaeon]